MAYTFSWVLITCTLAYCATAVASLVLLARVRPGNRRSGSSAGASTGDQDLPTISVLVAARNEELTLPRCLDALVGQDTPFPVEFIVADDQSADGTAGVVHSYAERDDRFRLISIREPVSGLHGKANALHQAILASSGDLLLVTDADCAPPPGWVRHMAEAFADSKLGISCGIAEVQGDRLLHRVQALDWLLLLSIASAGSEAGHPLTAMGNNMAIRRQAYLDVGGYPALPFSVTEDYALFRAVHRRTGWRVRLSLDAGTATRTLPLDSLLAVFEQRKRWARGGLDAGAGAYALYGIVFLTHAGLLAGLFLQPLLAAALLLLKCAADLAVVVQGMRRLGRTGLLSAFPAFEAYLFGYVVLLPVALLVSPRIRWKGRRF